MPEKTHQTEPQGRSRSGIIAAILHELLKVEQFNSSADLQEAVKCRCSKLHVPYDAEAVVDAIAFVARTRPVLMALRVDTSHRVRAHEAAPLSRDEAARLYRELFARFQEETPAAARSDGYPEHFPALIEIL